MFLKGTLPGKQDLFFAGQHLKQNGTLPIKLSALKAPFSIVSAESHPHGGFLICYLFLFLPTISFFI
jgi:hypothetical protein